MIEQTLAGLHDTPATPRAHPQLEPRAAIYFFSSPLTVTVLPAQVPVCMQLL